MQVPDEVIPVVCWQAHEGASHQNELHFVNNMTQLQQLVHTGAGLVHQQHYTVSGEAL